MTGEKNRFTTTEKLWKLEDGELSTPQHDELVLQLLSKVASRNLIETIGYINNWEFKDCYCNEGEIDFVKQHVSSNVNINDLSVLSEIPVQAKNGFLIGYIDIRIKVCVAVGWNKVTKEFTNNTVDIYLNGFPGVAAYNGSWDKLDRWSSVGFKYVNIEVKPKIKSFGETLRQINTYKVYDKDAIYVIYSPDTRFKEAFESQGIKFVTPADIGIKE